jgi:hypothetical protein
MRAVGYRKVRIGPHLAYRDQDIPGTIPANAVLTYELWMLDVKKHYQIVSPLIRLCRSAFSVVPSRSVGVPLGSRDGPEAPKDSAGTTDSSRAIQPSLSGLFPCQS